MAARARTRRRLPWGSLIVALLCFALAGAALLLIPATRPSAARGTLIPTPGHVTLPPTAPPALAPSSTPKLTATTTTTAPTATVTR